MDQRHATNVCTPVSYVALSFSFRLAGSRLSRPSMTPVVFSALCQSGGRRTALPSLTEGSKPSRHSLRTVRLDTPRVFATSVGVAQTAPRSGPSRLADVDIAFLRLRWRRSATDSRSYFLYRRAWRNVGLRKTFQNGDEIGRNHPHANRLRLDARSMRPGCPDFFSGLFCRTGSKGSRGRGQRSRMLTSRCRSAGRRMRCLCGQHQRDLDRRAARASGRLRPPSGVEHHRGGGRRYD